MAGVNFFDGSTFQRFEGVSADLVGDQGPTFGDLNPFTAMAYCTGSNYINLPNMDDTSGTVNMLCYIVFRVDDILDTLYFGSPPSFVVPQDSNSTGDITYTQKKINNLPDELSTDTAYTISYTTKSADVGKEKVFVLIYGDDIEFQLRELSLDMRLIQSNGSLIKAAGKALFRPVKFRYVWQRAIYGTNDTSDSESGYPVTLGKYDYRYGRQTLIRYPPKTYYAAENESDSLANAVAINYPIVYYQYLTDSNNGSIDQPATIDPNVAVDDGFVSQWTDRDGLFFYDDLATWRAADPARSAETRAIMNPINIAFEPELNDYGTSDQHSIIPLGNLRTLKGMNPNGDANDIGFKSCYVYFGINNALHQLESGQGVTVLGHVDLLMQLANEAFKTFDNENTATKLDTDKPDVHVRPPRYLDLWSAEYSSVGSFSVDATTIQLEHEWPLEIQNSGSYRSWDDKANSPNGKAYDEDALRLLLVKNYTVKMYSNRVYWYALALDQGMLAIGVNENMSFVPRSGNPAQGDTNIYDFKSSYNNWYHNYYYGIFTEFRLE